MHAGRMTLAAILAAGLVAGAGMPVVAQQSATPPQTPVQPQDGHGPTKPAEGGAQTPVEPQAGGGATKPAEGGAQKPAEGTAPKRAEDAAPKPRLVSILGREVSNREGDGGRVIDVLVDHEGRLGAVVVEFGGFLGIGSRKVVVDWNALRFLREGNRTHVIVDISREQIRDAAEYKAGEQTGVLGTR